MGAGPGGRGRGEARLCGLRPAAPAAARVTPAVKHCDADTTFIY